MYSIPYFALLESFVNCLTKQAVQSWSVVGFLTRCAECDFS
jgi:hypothetical protein